ncbi:hypothetical protein HYW74_04060 [Candidatus Pacearchaeota archaeon]|nr:hypothetical protein [Candidatus Pacearchaeota archaeon]
MKNKKFKLSKLAWIKATAYAFTYLAIIMFVVGIKYEISRIISFILIAISIIFLIYSAILDKKNLSKKVSERKLLYKQVNLAYYILLSYVMYAGGIFIIIISIYGLLIKRIDFIALYYFTLVGFFIIGCSLAFDKTLLKIMKEKYLKELKIKSSNFY